MRFVARAPGVPAVPAADQIRPSIILSPALANTAFALMARGVSLSTYVYSTGAVSANDMHKKWWPVGRWGYDGACDWRVFLI